MTSRAPASDVRQNAKTVCHVGVGAVRDVRPSLPLFSTRLARRAAGRALAFHGTLNVFVGTVFRRQERLRTGHRQRAVGMLQLNCEVDRRTADAFVHRWLLTRVSSP